MRAGRLVSLLVLLQDHGRLSASALASELEVSTRTILRDIEALSGAGVPVFAVRGAAGGFELLGDYRRELPSIATPRQRTEGARPARARLRLSPHARRLATVTGRPPGVRVAPSNRADADGWVAATMPLGALEPAVLDLLALGDGVEVLAPPELRMALRRAAERIARRHR